MSENKNKKTEPSKELQERLNGLDPELQAIAAEFPDFAEVVAGADFNAVGPQIIGGGDPNMRYYFAAKDDPSHPGGVEQVMQKGYQVSDKEHTSPDCELMETPRKLWDYRQRQMAQQNQKKLRAVRRNVEEPTTDGLEVMDHVRSPRGAKPGFQKLVGE